MHSIHDTYIILDIDTFPQALEEVFTGKASILERMRISCTFHRQDGSEIGGCGEIGIPLSIQMILELNVHRMAGHE
jgi:NADH kinase